jgi:uncharacterized protein (DUF302 family)
MKKFSIVFMGLFFLVGMGVSFASTSNNQVFFVDNSKGSINAKSVEKAFNESGMHVDVNNDMNSIFKKRYKKVHHKYYNLAIFSNSELVTKLAKKYPSIGLITPLSMSIYSDDAKNTINISTLSLQGMSRITKIPESNPNLIAYAKLLDKALHKALPNGKYLPKEKSATVSSKKLVSSFTTEFELEDGATYKDAKESFEEEFAGEIGTVGFLVPKLYKLQEDVFKENGDYDFYDTYSIIRFNVIFPVSKNHPDAGSYAPFSLAIYKKKGEDSVHISYPSITNWIDDLSITDKEVIAEIQKTQKMMSGILTELTE